MNDFFEESTLMLAINYPAQVFEKIQPGDFSDEFEPFAQAAFELFEAGKAVDVVTVAEAVQDAGYKIPASKLLDLATTAKHSSIENLDHYTDILKQRAVKRQAEYALLSARQILSEEKDPETAIQRVISKFQELTANQSKGLRIMPEAVKNYILEMEERFESGGEIIGLSTGFDALDKRLGGMRSGDLIIVAGRPGMGKTTFALNIGRHNAIEKRNPVLVFSMEMGSSQLLEKLHADIGKISLNSLRCGKLQGDEWAKFSSAAQIVKDAPLYIDERGALTPAQVKARCFEVKRRYGLSLIIVDYIQLMRGAGDNRTGQITDITTSLKALAKDMDCPVIALSQLNRGVENRQDKRPTNADLRESGSIEQDADVILFPYRESYYTKTGDNTVELITSKSRMGETGSDGLEWQGKFSRFLELDYTPNFERSKTMTTTNKKGFTNYEYQ